MKKLFYLVLVLTSFANAQIYEVKVEFQHHTKYTPEYIEKFFGNIKDADARKWNIEQNENPKPLDYLIYSSEKEYNSIEQERIDNAQDTKGGVKKSVAGLPFGLTYSDFTAKENYREVDVYGKKYIVKTPIEKLNWEVTNESKEILGYKVHKAKSKYTVANTVFDVEAWFTKDIDFNFMPIAVQPLDGFVLEMNLSIEIPEVGRMDNFIRVQNIKPNVRNYKFKNPLKSDKKSKLKIISQDELNDIYDEANRKRNEMFNQSSAIDTK